MKIIHTDAHVGLRLRIDAIPHRLRRWLKHRLGLCIINCHSESGYAFCSVHGVDDEEMEATCSRRAINRAWDRADRWACDGPRMTRFQEWVHRRWRAQKPKAATSSPIDFSPDNWRRRRHWFSDIFLSVWADRDE